MIDTMPRPRPPHLVRQVTRHGAVVWYVRVGKGQRIRLRNDYGTPEFEAEYQAAISGAAQPARRSTVKAGSLSWLIERYRESTSSNQVLIGDPPAAREHLQAGHCNSR